MKEVIVTQEFINEMNDPQTNLFVEESQGVFELTSSEEV